MSTINRDGSDWLRQAGRTALKVNAGWLAQVAGPWLVAAGVAVFALALAWRSAHGALPSWQAALAVGALVCLVLAGALAAAWRRRITRRQALVLLEAELGLHNALTAALHGRAPWPSRRAGARDGLRWDWRRLAGPPLFLAACIMAGLLLPVAGKEDAPAPPGQPQAWQQVEDWLEQLREEKVADEQALKEVQEQLDALKQRPQEQWFSHESLNAADGLREQLRQDIRSLGRNLADAARGLDALGSKAEQLSQAGREQMQRELSQALEQMRSGGLKPDAELLDQLSKVDPKDLKGLSKEQLEQLRKSMKDKSGACESMGQGFGQEKGFLGDGEGEDDAQAQGRQGDKMPTGPQDGGAGNGGVSRGPGTAPLTLADEESDFGTDKAEALSSRDFSKAQPGTLLGVQDGRHEVDKKPAAPAAAGAVRDLGQGGGQVWQENLSPEEKAVLKQVFR